MEADCNRNLSENDKSTLARGQEGKQLVNWAQTFFCVPDRYFEPSTAEEIRQILQLASNLQKKVRVIGNCCSPSDVSFTNGFAISLKKFSQVIEIDKDKLQVTVQGGLIITKLNEILDDNGMALSVLGSVSDISCAGAVSTGTHGTGNSYGNLATSVVGLEVMTAAGEIICCSRDKNKELFLTVLCGCGAAGIILTLTWQCEPAFKLHQREKMCPLDKVLDNLDEEINSSDHVRFMWYPHTDTVVLCYNDRTDKPVKGSASWFWDYAVGYYTLEFWFWLSSFIPGLVPWINWAHLNLFHPTTAERVDKSYKVFNFECLFKQYVTEWAIPRNKTGYVLRKLREWLKESGFRAHFPLEVRFVKKDDIHLSPSYGRDTCYINIISYRPFNKDIPIEPYWSYYEDLMLSVGGRPHWAKAHKVTAEQFEQLYPAFKTFRDICTKLDPNGMFINEYLERAIFGKSKL